MFSPGKRINYPAHCRDCCLVERWKLRSSYIHNHGISIFLIPPPGCCNEKNVTFAIIDNKWFVWRPARFSLMAAASTRIHPHNGHTSVCVQVSYFGKREGGGRRKKGDTGGNNAGLEKLKKRARRAAITSDVSRPNDRHLSARSRCYAKSSPHCHSVPPCCQ